MSLLKTEQFKQFKKDKLFVTKTESQIKRLERQKSEVRDEIRKNFNSMLKQLNFKEKVSWDFDYKEVTYEFTLNDSKDFPDFSFKFINEQNQSSIDFHAISKITNKSSYIYSEYDFEKFVKFFEHFIKHQHKELVKLENESSRFANSLRKFNENYKKKTKVPVFAKMSNSEFLKFLKIPIVSYTVKEGKRSRVFSKKVYTSASHENFQTKLKEYFLKFGKPINVIKNKMDSRDGNQDFSCSFNGEREWSYEMGERLKVVFDNNGTPEYVYF
jgi:hypothetical protein